MRRLIVALPCLNEAEALPALLASLALERERMQPGVNVEALVVDDGSTDNTATIAQETGSPGSGWRVHLVQHAGNQGLGAALLTAIEWFAQNCEAPDCLAVMDADGTHPPMLLVEMLRKLDSGTGVVIASRYAPGGEEHGLSLRRRIYSRGASLLMGLAARVRGARDYSSGYRLYSYAALAAGRQRYGARLVTERSFVCMAELLCKLGACGVTIAEVPLELHYELKAGASKMNVPVTIRRYVALLGRLLFTTEFRRG